MFGLTNLKTLIVASMWLRDPNMNTMKIFSCTAAMQKTFLVWRADMFMTVYTKLWSYGMWCTLVHWSQHYWGTACLGFQGKISYRKNGDWRFLLNGGTYLSKYSAVSYNEQTCCNECEGTLLADVSGLPALIRASVITFVIVCKVQLSVQFSYLLICTVCKG